MVCDTKAFYKRKTFTLKGETLSNERMLGSNSFEICLIPKDVVYI